VPGAGGGAGTIAAPPPLGTIGALVSGGAYASPVPAAAPPVVSLSVSVVGSTTRPADGGRSSSDLRSFLTRQPPRTSPSSGATVIAIRFAVWVLIPAV
jgi:hypothetical protein